MSTTTPRRSKVAAFKAQPGLLAGIGGGEALTSEPYPSSQSVIRGNSLIAICDSSAAKLELCGALCRDEKNPEASRFCNKPNSCRTQGHKNGEKALIARQEFMFMIPIQNERSNPSSSHGAPYHSSINIALPFATLTLLL